MLDLNKSEIQKLTELLGDDPSSSVLVSKLESMLLLDFETSITKTDLDTVNEILDELQELNIKYSNLDFKDLYQFDSIKRKLGVLLATLSTFKDKFFNEFVHLEHYLKKEVNARVLDMIVDEGTKSVTRAREMVEMDIRYTRLRDRLYNFKKLATNVKTKYDFYMKLWQSVIQNVSTSGKEQKMSDMSGAT